MSLRSNGLLEAGHHAICLFRVCEGSEHGQPFILKLFLQNLAHFLHAYSDINVA